MLAIVPGIQVAVPRDEQSLRQALREAVAVTDAPTVVRFPKGRLAEPLPAVATSDGCDLLHADPEPDVLIVGVGSMAPAAREAAEKLSAEGYAVAVASPLWVIPLPASVVDLAERIGRVVTIEDNGLVGGVGSSLAAALADRGAHAPVTRIGIPQKFLRHASRPAILEAAGMTAQGCADAARRLLTEPS
jgi:1-deoxy-D-xylulose-5-phosphate synthase